NDHSTDNTEQLIDHYSEKYAFVTKLNTDSSEVHMPGSKVINAFNKGLALLDDHYDFVVKLAADIILPKTYFEKIATVFSEHPEMRIAGGLPMNKIKTERGYLTTPWERII